ncbi:MAG TPA: ParB N-terminal domain-containing protein, partial [Bacillota bacterium]|nr:ParB N-terminal domain-containing protein [Bacillota bacterium]
MNRKLYGDEAPPADFIESVRRHGIMVPLAIKEDGTIISGHRRWQAALALGMETVPVQIVDYADDLDEREAIIEFNRQREKTFSQKMAEAEELETVERERARRRKAEAGKANLPTVSAGNVSTTHEDKGRTRDKVAAAVGLGSGRTYETAKKVWEAAKNGDETAKKLVEELDAGKTTVHAAYKELMKEAEAPTPASHPVPAKVADEEAEEVPAKETVFSPEPATPAARPHVAYNSGNNEWYTPPEYIEAA